MLILIAGFFAVAFIQLVYFITFLVALKKKRLEKTGGLEPVSVIVSAHDEEENLKQLVPLLLQQEYPVFEVIIVNDRSNDETYDFLLAETKKDTRLKMVNVKSTPDHVNSKKYALTLGIRAAAHDWILLTDADCRPKSSLWISRMSEQFTPANQFVIGFSPYQNRKGFLNLFIRYEALVTAMQYLSFALLKNPYMGVGRNLAYRKSLFLEKKGFNNYLHVTGGDDDLFVNQHANGRNTSVQLHDESQVESVPKTTFGAFFNQKIRHMSVGKRYKFKHKLLLGLFGITWLLTWFAAIPLLWLYEYYYAVIAALVLRWIFEMLCIDALVKQSRLAFKTWAVPVLDFLYPFYYLSTGLVTLMTKKVRWKS